MKIAYVVGHNRDKRGAVRVDTKETEYDFMGRIGSLMAEMAGDIEGVEVKIFRREPGLGYKREIEAVYDAVDEWGADVSIEGHFNSFDDPRANGCETLSSGSVKSLALAKAVNDAIIDESGAKDRGILTRSRQDRGGRSLFSGRAPAIMIEPFFGSNAADCQKFRGAEAERRLAGAILSGAVEALGGAYLTPPKPVEREIPAEVVAVIEDADKHPASSTTNWGAVAGIAASAWQVWQSADPMVQVAALILIAVFAYILRERLRKMKLGRIGKEMLGL